MQVSVQLGNCACLVSQALARLEQDWPGLATTDDKLETGSPFCQPTTASVNLTSIMDHDDNTNKNYVERGTGHLVVTSGIHYTSLSWFVQSDLGCYYIGHCKPCHLLVQTHTGF